MNNKSLIIGAVIGFILGMVIFSFFSLGRYINNENETNQMFSMMGNMDRHFIEQMIPHHEGAIAMSQLALQKAKRPEVKTLANNIITSQQKEISEMKGWYQDWFGTQVASTSQYIMGGQMMGGGIMHMGSMSGDLNALQNTKDFDVEFVKEMIPHHEMAVMMAEMLKSITNRPEMKTLADNIITSQSQEIEMMRGWLNTWSVEKPQ